MSLGGVLAFTVVKICKMYFCPTLVWILEWIEYLITKVLSGTFTTYMTCMALTNQKRLLNWDRGEHQDTYWEEQEDISCDRPAFREEWTLMEACFADFPTILDGGCAQYAAGRCWRSTVITYLKRASQEALTMFQYMQTVPCALEHSRTIYNY